MPLYSSSSRKFCHGDGFSVGFQNTLVILNLPFSTFVWTVVLMQSTYCLLIEPICLLSVIVLYFFFYIIYEREIFSKVFFSIRLNNFGSQEIFLKKGKKMGEKISLFLLLLLYNYFILFLNTNLHRLFSHFLCVHIIDSQD